jgi:hypothetical protein
MQRLTLLPHAPQVDCCDPSLTYSSTAASNASSTTTPAAAIIVGCSILNRGSLLCWLLVQGPPVGCPLDLLSEWHSMRPYLTQLLLLLLPLSLQVDRCHAGCWCDMRVTLLPGRLASTQCVLTSHCCCCCLVLQR